MLDAASVRPDTILLLDTFFHVVIFHGETIGAWREQGYQVGVGGGRSVGSGVCLRFCLLSHGVSSICRMSLFAHICVNHYCFLSLSPALSLRLPLSLTAYGRDSLAYTYGCVSPGVSYVCVRCDVHANQPSLYVSASPATALVLCRSWRANVHQDQEEHAAFRQLLEAPQADAQLIMQSRSPVPR